MKRRDLLRQALVSKPAPLSGEELRFLRNELDRFQKTLAKTLGISEQSIARWEKQGEASPEGDRLIRLVYAGTKWGEKKLAPFIEQLNRIEQKQSRNRMILRERHKSWEHQAKLVTGTPRLTYQAAANTPSPRPNRPGKA